MTRDVDTEVAPKTAVTPGELGKLELIKRIAAASKAGDNIGDAGIYKLELVGGMEPDDPRMRELLAPVAGYHPRVDLDALADLAPGSLGREYADHMRLYGLRPLNVSPQLLELARAYPLGARYLVTHDLFHTVLGFDTSAAGEVGVYAFAAGQRYSPGLTRAYRSSVVAFTLYRPHRIGDLLRARRWGLAMGRAAAPLITCRFEERWEQPLADLRAEYRIEPAPTRDGTPPA